MRSRLYQNAAACYAEGGDGEKAVRLLEMCVEESPATRGVRLKLVKLYLSSPLDVAPEKVLKCLREEERIDPSFGEDPRGSIALMLGEMAGNDLRATLRKVAESNPADLRFMTAVVARHWTPFRSLDEKSQKEWVGAIRTLWVDPLGALVRRRVAGTFADIVEDQLRRLLDRFRLEKANVVLQKISPGSKEDKFLKYLEKGSHLTLGEMISEINGTRYPDLKAWLQLNAHRLWRDWDTKRAWRLNDLRRPSSHGGSELSEHDAIELYELSAWFLSRLYAD